MARDNISNAVYVFTKIPEKSEVGHFVYTGEARRISSDFNVVFSDGQMVRFRAVANRELEEVGGSRGI